MPDVFTYLFEGVRHPSSGLQGLFDSITIVLSTPCESLVLLLWLALADRRSLRTVLVAGLVAVVLNLIIPRESLEDEEDEGEEVGHVVEDVEASDRVKD